MSLCINPNCKHNNSERQLFCQSCGSEILLQGRYQVVRLLSEKGGFADTYEVMHHGVIRVMKVLKDSHPKAIELFEREFEVLSQSDHLGIPKAEEYFEFRPHNSSEPLYCLVMEKILGTDLEEYLNQRHHPIDEHCAIDWLDQISHILKFIHARNLLHRDIKPSNIILQPNGQLTLIDFGAVGCFNHVQIVQPSASPTYIYTEGYTAPEQISGNAVPESDFFALGRTLVYLLTGKEFIQMRDAEGEFNWETHASHLSPELVAQIDLMMRQQVRDRPHRATELIDWVTEHRSIAKSPSGFHNRSGSLPTHTTNPTSPTLNVSGVPTAGSTGISGSTISATEHVKPVVARSPNPKRKGLIIGGTTIAGIALLAACAQGIGLLMNPSPNPPITQSENSGTLVADRLCSSPDLVQKSGNLYGVIEIGSKSVKAEVIQELDRLNDAGFKYVARDEQEDIETRDVNPTNVNAQDATVKAVTAAMKELQDRFQIPCEQIVIYGSSGLAKKAAHKVELIAAIQAATGRKVDLISAADEAKYVFDGVVPEWRRDRVITLDIGSGNTKGAYLKNGNKNYETYEVPVGTADFARQIDKQRGETSFTVAAKAQKNAVVIPEIRNAIQLKPALLNSPRIYLAGGISWALATLIHPCDKEQTVVRKEERVASFARLRAEDINTFYNNATRDRQTLFQPNLSACTPEQLKKVQKAINKIQTESFSENELIAGAEILRAFSQELKFAEKDRIFFARYSMEALSIGYLIQQLETRSN